MEAFRKKQYVKIAETINKSSAKTKYELAQDLAIMFALDSERFDINKFLKACGITL